MILPNGEDTSPMAKTFRHTVKMEFWLRQGSFAKYGDGLFAAVKIVLPNDKDGGRRARMSRSGRGRTSGWHLAWRWVR